MPHPTLFKQLTRFNRLIGHLKSKLTWQSKVNPTDGRIEHIQKILNKLTQINTVPIRDGNYKHIRDEVTNCYTAVIPLGFRIFELSSEMAGVIEDHFDQWTAIPHFGKFEIDLTESSYTRDHYLHPLCVFGIGVYTLTCFWKAKVLPIEKVIDVFGSWLFCSLLHDLGYVIEHYSGILDVFFSKFLIVNYKATFDFREVRFSGNYPDNLRTFNTAVTACVRRMPDGQNVESAQIDSIVSNVLYSKNDHGLISALSALERIDNVIGLFRQLNEEAAVILAVPEGERESLLNSLKKQLKAELEKLDTYQNPYIEYITNAPIAAPPYEPFERLGREFKQIKTRFQGISLAIGMHNHLIMELQQNLTDMAITVDVNNHNDDDLLVFLLLYCDAIQDWGRSTPADNKFELNTLEFDGSSKSLVATYTVHNQKDDTILDKLSELRRIEEYLKISNFSLIIRFDNLKEFAIC